MSMFDATAGGRSIGVGIPTGQLSPGTGQPRTITGFMELKNVAIEYVDDAGNKHRTIAMLDAHGQWYLPPNGENFAATLRPLAAGTWLAKALSETLNKSRAAAETTDPADVPATDAAPVI
jgi:hypothetical protein